MANIGGNTTRHFVIQLICAVFLMTVGACTAPTVEELTSTNPYANIVGTKYRIVSNVNAYGIYQDLDKKVIKYITLIPGVGIDGPEVAFSRPLTRGEDFTIVSAWRKLILFGSVEYYVITFDSDVFPPGIEVRIDLIRGNEGDGAELNQHIYERLTK